MSRSSTPNCIKGIWISVWSLLRYDALYFRRRHNRHIDPLCLFQTHNSWRNVLCASKTQHLHAHSRSFPRSQRDNVRYLRQRSIPLFQHLHKFVVIGTERIFLPQRDIVQSVTDTCQLVRTSDKIVMSCRQCELVPNIIGEICCVSFALGPNRLRASSIFLVTCNSVLFSYLRHLSLLHDFPLSLHIHDS
jgi:hypothetical protein